MGVSREVLTSDIVQYSAVPEVRQFDLCFKFDEHGEGTTIVQLENKTSICINTNLL